MRSDCTVPLTQKDAGSCDISCSLQKKPSDSTEEIQEYFRRQLASVSQMPAHGEPLGMGFSADFAS